MKPELTDEQLEKLSHLYYGDLGQCGCGRAEEVQGFLSQLMKLQKEYRDRIDLGGYSDDNRDTILHKQTEEADQARLNFIKSTDPEIIFEFVFHVLEDKGFAEHGGQVYGSWLTDKGNQLQELMALNYKSYQEANKNEVPDYKPIELTEELRQTLIKMLPYDIRAEEIKDDRELRLRCYFGKDFEFVRSKYPELLKE